MGGNVWIETKKSHTMKSLKVNVQLCFLSESCDALVNRGLIERFNAFCPSGPEVSVESGTNLISRKGNEGSLYGMLVGWTSQHEHDSDTKDGMY